MSADHLSGETISTLQLLLYMRIALLYFCQHGLNSNLPSQHQQIFSQLYLKNVTYCVKTTFL